MVFIFQGRKKAMKVIHDIFEKKRSGNDGATNDYDFADHLLEQIKKEDTFLNEEIARDLVFLFLFAAHETTSTALTVALRYLDGHPRVMAELKVRDFPKQFLPLSSVFTL